MQKFVIKKGSKKLDSFQNGDFPYTSKNVFKDGLFSVEKTLCIVIKWFKSYKTSYCLYNTEAEAKLQIQFMRNCIKSDDRILKDDIEKALKICDNLKIVLDDGKMN